MKIIGYYIFALFYYAFRLFCPIKTKKVFAIMTHDSSKDGNVGYLVEYLKKKEEGYTFEYLKKSDRNLAKSFHLLKGKVSFFIWKPFHLATAEYVLLDNVFLPMAYLKFRGKVKVIQLWHGTGTIKKFGQDVNTGTLKILEKKANSRITHLIVNSEETREIYGGAFGVARDKVYCYGLPRTDLFFDPRKIRERKQKFYERYPNLVGKTLVLYAPTFRDREKDHPSIALDLELLSQELPEQYVFMLRLHPFVMEAFQHDAQPLDDKEKDTNIVSMSDYPDISTLLLVADYLITDYSSSIFEYCLRERPMIFHAYDLEEFEHNARGFYRPYREYVPGPIARDTGELIALLKQNQFDFKQIQMFKDKNYQYQDGNSTERLYLHIFQS